MSDRTSLITKLKIIREIYAGISLSDYNEQTSTEEIRLIYMTALAKAHTQETIVKTKQIVLMICHMVNCLQKKGELPIEDISKMTTREELMTLCQTYIKHTNETLSPEGKSEAELKLMEMFRQMGSVSSMGEIEDFFTGYIGENLSLIRNRESLHQLDHKTPV